MLRQQHTNRNLIMENSKRIPLSHLAKSKLKQLKPGYYPNFLKITRTEIHQSEASSFNSFNFTEDENLSLISDVTSVSSEKFYRLGDNVVTSTPKATRKTLIENHTKCDESKDLFESLYNEGLDGTQISTILFSDEDISIEEPNLNDNYNMSSIIDLQQHEATTSSNHQSHLRDFNEIITNITSILEENDENLPIYPIVQLGTNLNENSNQSSQDGTIPTFRVENTNSLFQHQTCNITSQSQQFSKISL